MNVLNVLVIADLGITNIIDAVLYSLRLSYYIYSIQASLHCLSKSSCNKHNRIITTVVPLLTQYASNINNKLFPSPVAITLTIRLYLVIIAYIVFSCNLEFGLLSHQLLQLAIDIDIAHLLKSTELHLSANVFLFAA